MAKKASYRSVVKRICMQKDQVTGRGRARLGEWGRCVVVVVVEEDGGDDGGGERGSWPMLP